MTYPPSDDPLRKQPDPSGDQPPGGYPPPGSYPPPPQGSYPPPGAYPPPQQGSYPPPPPGAYPPPPPGAYPPPGGFGGAPGYGGPPGFTPPPTQYSVGDAISVGWERFKDNPGTWIGFFVLNFAVIAVAFVIYFFAIVGAAFASDSVDSTSTGFSVGFIALSAVFFVVLVAIFFVFQAAAIQGALQEVAGQRAQFGSMFRFRKLGDVIVASLIVGLIVGIGLALFYLPGIIAGFLLANTLYFVVDDGLSPVEAIKASFRLATGRFGDVFVLFLLTGIIGGIGAVICYVGVVVTAPIAAIAQAYGFRMFTGKPVAPVKLR
ncbi:hypothetical protein ASG12_03085 [Williamsia sp. Leaf354]|uniref:hypothetical protein n=1 Tax=Williamsia sp. Leaf354 TaxID=1736349 RepID=UPI0006F9D186|nr:hypothetical protein [Williamsia sp. Leaf354]KQR99776.1 hypothetical protein ASG12_03085 [Williamsia sp. Leaf354]